jgi:hypothetical protein
MNSGAWVARGFGSGFKRQFDGHGHARPALPSAHLLHFLHFLLHISLIIIIIDDGVDAVWPGWQVGGVERKRPPALPWSGIPHGSVEAVGRA